jgi:1,4-alpha-glucan branching enzyme
MRNTETKQSNTPTESPERCRAEFGCRAPGAKQVFLVGSFNNWDTRANPMTGRDNGQWTTVLELLPGFYHYKFVVDGQWCCEFGQTDQSPRCAACGCSGDGCVPNVYGTTDRFKIVG